MKQFVAFFVDKPLPKMLYNLYFCLICASMYDVDMHACLCGWAYLRSPYIFYFSSVLCTHVWWGDMRMFACMSTLMSYSPTQVLMGSLLSHSCTCRHASPHALWDSHVSASHLWWEPWEYRCDYHAGLLWIILGTVTPVFL